MTKTDLSQLRQQLQAVPHQLAALLPTLLDRGGLLKAYLSFAPRTCGKPGCRCGRGERHPAWILRYPEGRRTRSRSLSRADYERLQRPAEEYRRFRRARGRWKRLVQQADGWLRQLEALRSLELQKELPDE